MSFNPLRLLDRRRLRKALELYQQSPGIDETVDVVHLFLKCGDGSRAFQYADNGYQRFPSSRKLLELRQETLKEMSREECRQLTRMLSRRASPKLIAKVIEIQRSLGDFAACDKLARRWQSKFEDSWVLQFAIGKYLFQRSLVEKDPELSRCCLEQLQRAAALNEESYKTMLYLGTLLYQLGSIPEAREAVETLLRHHPSDPKARALLECISHASEVVTDGEAPEVSAAANVALGKLRLDPAVQAVLVHMSKGEAAELEHSYFANNATFDLSDADEALAELIHSMKVSSNRMGIGELKTCKLEGETWQMFFRNHPYRTLFLCTSDDFPDEDFERIANHVSPEGVMA